MDVDSVAPVGPCYGDTRGQAATPRHVGDKSSGYQGNGVSNGGASAQSTGRLGLKPLPLSEISTAGL